MEQEQVNLIDDLIINGITEPKVEQEASAEEVSEEVKEESTEEESTEEESTETIPLDYTVKVPLASGEDITLGQMKDYYQDAKRSELQRIDATNEANKRLQEARELSQYYDVLPPHVKQQLQEQQQAHIRDEFTRLLEVIPAWSSAASFTAGKDAVYALADAYGLKDDVSRVVDHRVIKLLHDFHTLRDSIKRAKESVQPIRSKTTPGKPHKQPSNQDKQDQLITRAKQSNSMSDKLSAIDSLIS